MQVIDYIDWKGIYNKIKKSHLEYYPTAESYIKELEDLDESYDYVEEMYRILNEDLSDFDVDSSDTYDDISFQDILKEGKLHIEFSKGGDDYWSYGLVFTVNLDEERFIGYNYENYS